MINDTASFNITDSNTSTSSQINLQSSNNINKDSFSSAKKSKTTRGGTNLSALDMGAAAVSKRSGVSATDELISAARAMLTDIPKHSSAQESQYTFDQQMQILAEQQTIKKLELEIQREKLEIEKEKANRR